MNKKYKIAYDAINVMGFLGGNPYSHCPICRKRIYGALDYNNEDNPTIMYSVIRKSIGRIPIVGGKISRFVAESLYDPTYRFYCYNCDYEWVLSHKDAK